VEWGFEWIVYYLKRWAFVEFLEVAGRFGVLVAAITYLLGADERAKLKYYQAWQVINSARGSSGDGGRRRAIMDLHADGHRLVGLNVRGANISDLNLRAAFLGGAEMDSVTLVDSDFSYAMLPGSRLQDAFLLRTDFTSVEFQGVDLRGAEMYGVSFCGASFHGGTLRGADLLDVSVDSAFFTGADLRDMTFSSVQSVNYAAISSVRYANVAGTPDEFREWALARGALSIEADSAWIAAKHNLWKEVRAAERSDSLIQDKRREAGEPGLACPTRYRTSTAK
jgi:hypothetical protein